VQAAQLGGVKLSDLLPRLREQFEADPAIQAQIQAETTIGALTGEAQTKAQAILGREALTQLIYRPHMLQVIGRLWVEYLTQVEALRTAIGLEAYAQRDPLVAYKAKAFDLFQELLVNMRAGVVSHAFNFAIGYLRNLAERQAAAARPAPAQSTPPKQRASGKPALGQAPRPAAPAPRVVATPTAPPPEARNLSRNAACWCGSGKKYKDCHHGQDHAAQASATEAAISTTTPIAPETGGRKRRRH
jgi:preprotein translocase subunit SecA